MAKKENNNEKKNINKEEKKMAKKIRINLVNGIINIVAIDGKACEPRRFGTYTGGENNVLPSITITPKVGGWLKLSPCVVEDKNGKMYVTVNHEADAYWAMAEYIMGSKKTVNAAKKNLVAKRQEVLAAREQQAVQNNNGTLIGATTHGYIYQKQMPGTQIEVIDLGKFGKRSMKWGKGLDCSKIFKEEEEVARIFWQKSGEPAKIRLMGEEEKHYYMLSYTEDDFIYFNEKKEKIVVKDQALRNALWFFYRNFVMKLAELKGWKLPEKKTAYYQDKGYWAALEKEYEAEEAMRQAAHMAKKNSNKKV